MTLYLSEKIADYIYFNKIEPALRIREVDEQKRNEVHYSMINSINSLLNEIYKIKSKYGIYNKVYEYNNLYLRKTEKRYTLNEHFDYIKIIETNDPGIVLSSIIDNEYIFTSMNGFLNLLFDLQYFNFIIINGYRKIDENLSLIYDFVSPIYTFEKDSFSIIVIINIYKYEYKSTNHTLNRYHEENTLGLILKYHLKQLYNVKFRLYIDGYSISIPGFKYKRYYITYITLSYNIKYPEIKHVLEYDFFNHIMSKIAHTPYSHCILCGKKIKDFMDDRCIDYIASNIVCKLKT